MNSKTESFQHLFEQNQSESPNDINKIKVLDLGSDLERISIDSDFERERLKNIRRLTPKPANLDVSELHKVEEMNNKAPKKMPKLKVVSLTILAGSLVGSAVILILFSIVKFLINI